MELRKATTKLHNLFIGAATLQPGGTRSAFGDRRRLAAIAIATSMAAVTVFATVIIAVAVMVVAADTIVTITKSGGGHGKTKACAHRRASVRRGHGSNWLGMTSGFGGWLRIMLRVGGIVAGRVSRIVGLLAVVLRRRVPLRSGMRRITRIIMAFRGTFLLVLVTVVAAVVVVVLLAVGLLGLGMGCVLPRATRPPHKA